MEETTIIYLFAGIASLVIMYFIIMLAVKAGNKELFSKLEFITLLKMAEMKKQGYGDAVENVKELEAKLTELKKAKADGYLDAAAYKQKLKQLTI